MFLVLYLLVQLLYLFVLLVPLLVSQETVVLTLRYITSNYHDVK